jgi:pimeloyl-ACP methyl ester carboxylesterase
VDTVLSPAPGRFLAGNGVDMHFLDTESGRPVILLHGGTASNHPAWDAMNWGWHEYLSELSGHFRVITPDARGHGWTRNTAGAVSYTLLADDLAALITGLGLERPWVIGFSDGGITATVLAIREPDSLGGIVNIAGYDLFDPAAPSMGLVRRSMGKDPAATQPDLEAIAAAGGPWFDAMLATHDAAQGRGTWRTLLVDAFDRWTAPIGYELDDLSRVTVPTLIMAGDRDVFCSPEESVRAFRRITGAELAIVPNRPHTISPEMVVAATEFVLRNAAGG